MPTQNCPFEPLDPRKKELPPEERQAVDIVFNPKFADVQALLRTINESNGNNPRKYQARLIG